MYNLKSPYVIIPGLTILIALLGSLCAWDGMAWYQLLILPSYVPSPWVFSIAWNIIFILTTYVVIAIWESPVAWVRKRSIIILFAMNAFLNVWWSYLFFYKQQIGLALFDGITLLINVIALMYYSISFSPFFMYLLTPYCIWMIFAVILNAHIWFLN